MAGQHQNGPILRSLLSLTMFEIGGRPTRTGLPALCVGVVALQKPPCISNTVNEKDEIKSYKS